MIPRAEPGSTPGVCRDAPCAKVARGLSQGHLAMSSARVTVLCCVGFFLCLCAGAAGQTSDAAWEVWPEVNAYGGIHRGLRGIVTGQTIQGVNFPYHQWAGLAEIGYQLKPIARPHLRNINEDKEHHFVIASSYEYLRTTQPGKTSNENRAKIDVSSHYRLGAAFLLADRNRVEFRWVNGEYSTRYRNRFAIERDFEVRKFRITPYTSIEAFYDGKHHSWNEVQYAFGVQLPYKQILMLDTYYMGQNCTTCDPNPLSIWGVKLNLYFRSRR
jgi:hypothetical protein